MQEEAPPVHMTHRRQKNTKSKSAMHSKNVSSRSPFFESMRYRVVFIDSLKNKNRKDICVCGIFLLKRVKTKIPY